ncbi:hypothetical protein E2562_007385 [Oryza meyeriana var. granulata]|uniref:Protein kinase domain-containing protein n=1 Tax=Oryza meyeriana var. granulata TaxID=110450 RepID=A0A6G1CZU4_9ORYZ|nr:hypothetical protein E2562_007385 [Oryza meyeriana var. granulata]
MRVMFTEARIISLSSIFTMAPIGCLVFTAARRGHCQGSRISPLDRTVDGIISSLHRIELWIANGPSMIRKQRPSVAPCLHVSHSPDWVSTVVPDSQIRDCTVERFLKEIAAEKPIRFTAQHLAGFTNYSARLVAGAFGTVYKGMLPNGLMVAVKCLQAGHDDRVSMEQFMAEVGTIGRIHHINLVRLFDFCFDATVHALVYEYMDNRCFDFCRRGRQSRML